jgi:hypothetical protein
MIIAKRYEQIAFAFIMAGLMSGFMSFVVTTFNIGFIDGLIGKWLQAWSFAFIVTFPAILILSPLVRRLLTVIVRP